MSALENMLETRGAIGVTSARLIHDNHGCIFHRKDGTWPESITEALENKHLEVLYRLVSEKDVRGLRMLTTLVSKIKAPWLNFRVEHAAQSEERHCEAYIDPYYVPASTQEAFRKMGSSFITIATGTPACCALSLAEKLREEGVWRGLDAGMTLFCTPPNELSGNVWPDKRILSPGSKMAAVGYCRILDGANPWAAVEDSLEIARYMAYFYDMRVLIPLPENEAVRRENARGLEFPSFLQGKTGRGQIEFGWDIPDILSEYRAYLDSLIDSPTR